MPLNFPPSPAPNETYTNGTTTWVWTGLTWKVKPASEVTLTKANIGNIEIASNTLSSTNTDGNITLDPNGSGYVNIVGTNGLKLPAGTILERGPAVVGTVRFNSETTQFEGYSNGTWSSLGGVQSVDGLTYITPESTPGASDDTLRFYTNGTLVGSWTGTGLSLTGPGFKIPTGNTAGRPSGVSGYIRYNTETAQFEGFAASSWSSLGGVRSVDGKTYIVAETSPGNSDDTLQFYSDDVQVATLDKTALTVKPTTAATAINTGALQVKGGVSVNGSIYSDTDLFITNPTGYTRVGKGTGSGLAGTNAVLGGGGALASNTTGYNILALGWGALASNTDGISNTAAGALSLNQNISGDNNSAFGANSLTNSLGNNNSAFGQGALVNLVNGNNNLAAGYNSGNAITSGNNNVVIGTNDGATINGLDNNIIISDGQGNVRLSFDNTGTATFDNPITVNNANVIKLNDGTNTNYISVRAPDNIDYSYVIKLPESQPIDYSVLANDGNGNTVWSQTDTFGGNRVYASDKYGDDANDGINRPVRTLKRACQIAASLGQRPKVQPSQAFYNAKRLLEDNRAYIQEETIGYINATYPSFSYNTATCKRDIGLIVDAVIYDMILGGNRRTVEGGQSYLSVVQVMNNQKVETLAAIQFTKNLSLSVIQNQSASVNYQNILTQTIRPTLNAVSAVTQVTALFNTLINVLDTGISPVIVQPAFDTIPITVMLSAGDFYIDNPIIIPDKVSVVGDSLRSVVIRPLNANKDMFRVRNGAYLTGITFRDGLDVNGVPIYTFSWAVAFDDPADTSVDRTGYFGLSYDKPVITLSPYIQNCSIISFLGGNGVLVDGSKVVTPNRSNIDIESENPVNPANGIPEQGKSMVSNAFTMLSFGGTGWLLTNDAYVQIVSCFQIFLLNGTYCQSGGYMSVTNSATNFGLYALRSSGYSANSFTFDRGYVAATGVNAGALTLTTIGTKRDPVAQYILRFRDNVTDADITQNFKTASTEITFNAATAINPTTEVFTIASHGLANGDAVVYTNEGNNDIPGLFNNGVYYAYVITTSTFKLYNDNGLSYAANVTDIGSGTHKLTKNVEDFFVGDTVSSHSEYQELTLAVGTYSFNPGQAIVATTGPYISNAYVLSYDSLTRKLIVSNELTDSGGNLQRILFTGSSVITSVAGNSVTINVDSVSALNDIYYTTVSTISSTVNNSTVQNPSGTILQKVYFHRPSIVNSSGHTWEYAGSGTDYNALPQNGGFGIAKYEQYSELPGRVYSSGTNELGDFKVGDFIVAENKTGNIAFKSRVTVGELAVLKLSLSSIEINQFSIDTGLGDNEPGGASNSRISTQKAIRSFVANRLGNVLDKSVSTNAVPGAVVQLNSQGQINADLLPPARGITTYNSSTWGGRLTLAEQIPAVEVISGDNAIETYTQQILVLNTATSFAQGDIVTQVGNTGYGVVVESVVLSTTVTLANVTGTWNLTSDIKKNGTALTGINPDTINTTTTVVDNYYLKKDTSSQFLILSPNVVYDFASVTTVTGANSSAQGIITSGPIYGIAYTLDNTLLIPGTNYFPTTGTEIYYNVPLTNVTGTGSGALANIIVTAGIVTSVSLVAGGTGYASGDRVSANSADIGGIGSGFEIAILRADTRLYVDLVGSYIKFTASSSGPEYLQDNNAIVKTIGDLTDTTQKAFNAVSISVGNVDYVNNRIVITSHGFADGDAVNYSNGGNSTIGNLINLKTYWVKVIDNNTVELYNNYGLTSGSKVVFGTSSAGTHNVIRHDIDVASNTVTIDSHGFTVGNAIKFTATTAPTGITSNNYYYVGSVTTNGFTLHTSRADALSSVNGVTISAVNITATGSGPATLTLQNVQVIGTVNTSSSVISNWGAIVQSTIDASSIVSGVISPSRLATTGSATDKTFLRGDSSWQYAVQEIRSAASSPISIAGDYYTNTGISYYYNSPVIDITRADDTNTNPNFTSLGVAAFNKTQFTVSTGETTIKTGVIDAGFLGGHASNYYTNPLNLVGTIPISKGGTNLTTFTKGDLLYSGSNNSLTQLSIGLANSVLTSDGLIPSWSTSLTLGGTLTVSGVTSVNDTTASTSTTTGALKVAGGLGVAGAINAGSVQSTPIGTVTASTGAFTTLTTNSTTTFSGNNTVITISPTGTGTVNISPAGILTLGTAAVTTSLIGNVSAVASDQTVTLSPTGLGTVTIAPATSGSINRMNIGATTRGTGAFTSLTSNGATTFTQNTASTSSTTGTVVVTGGVGVSGDLWTGGNVNGVSTRGTTSVWAGVNADGLVLNIGQGPYATVKSYSSKVTLTSYSTSTDLILSTNQSDTNGILVKGTTGDVKVQNTTTSTSTTTGALTVAGGVGVAENLYVGGNTIIAGDLTVNGTTTTVNSTTVTVDDKNIELGSVAVPTNTTADGGGITLKGATDKTFNWVNSSSAWTSSEHIDLATTKTFKISNVTVLSGSQVLGKGFTNAAGEIVTTDGTQTLSSKTFSGAGVTFNGSTSGSTVLKAAATAGTTTITMPTTSGTMALIGDVPSVGDATLSLSIGTASATNTTITIGTGTGFSANTATNAAYDIKVGPALTNLATLMATAGSGFIKRGATADTYTVDTNTYISAEADTLATVTGRGASTAQAINITNTTVANSTITGALKVAGGIGVGGDIYAGSVYSNGTLLTAGGGTSDSASPFETSLGYQAGDVNTGTNNTFIGYQSGKVNTTGNTNTAVGANSLSQNTTGLRNSAFGASALNSNTTGINNTAFGASALIANTTGNANVAMGRSTMVTNTTGTSNTALGTGAMTWNSSGGSNTAVGNGAMQENTTGSNNTALGVSALYLNTVGTNNTALGNNAGFSITTGSYNVVIGSNTGSTIATSNNNVIISDGQGNIVMRADSAQKVTFPGAVAISGVLSVGDGFPISIGATPSSKIGYNASYNQFITNDGQTGVLFNSSQLVVKAGYTDAFTVTSGTTFVANSIQISGTTTSQQSTEVLNTKTGATGTVVHDFLTGAIWYHSSISANFTANFTNVPTTNGRTIAFTLILAQGATAYIPNAVQIGGSAQTINWLGSTVPTGTANKKEIVSFTLIRTGSAWVVFGSLSTYG